MKYHNIPTLFDNQASLINGKNIGTDSVRYIQDAGQKTAGTTYIDKNTNELYVCVTTTNSVNNDSNFSKFNLKEAFNKLDILSGVYIEEILYTGDKYDGDITVKNIREYKNLRVTTNRGVTVHRNNITFRVEEFINLQTIVVDIESGGGTIKYISDTQLNIHGDKGYILEIIGIKF